MDSERCALTRQYAGFTLAVQNGDPEEMAKYKMQGDPTFCGVEQTEDMLRWIWESFSAVAGDHPTFEVWRESSLHDGILAP